MHAKRLGLSVAPKSCADTARFIFAQIYFSFESVLAFRSDDSGLAKSVTRAAFFRRVNRPVNLNPLPNTFIT